jgi:hypothetical protein
MPLAGDVRLRRDGGHWFRIHQHQRRDAGARVTPAVTIAQTGLVDAMAARDREWKGGVGRICLKLGIEFDDTHRLFGVPRTDDDPDILGAMFFAKARIVIDQSLDPEEYPAREGRYRFTLAHEGGGHWRLHRHLFAKDWRGSAASGADRRSSVPPAFLVDLNLEAVRQPRRFAIRRRIAPRAGRAGRAASAGARSIPRPARVLLANPAAALAELAGHRSDQAQRQ